MKIDAVILKNKKNDNTDKMIARLKAQSIEISEIKVLENREELSEMMEQCRDCDYVLLMEDNMLPLNKDMLKKLIERIEKSGENVALVYGKQEAKSGMDILTHYRMNYLYGDETYSGIEKAAETNNSLNAIFCSNACALYNMKHYDDVGGFPANAGTYEAMLYAAKAINSDYDVVYEPSAKVVSYKNDSIGEQFKNSFEFGMVAKKFHYILKDYNSDNGELDYMISAIKYLIRRKKYLFIIPLVVETGIRCIGDLLGRFYRQLPKEFVEKIIKSDRR